MDETTRDLYNRFGTMDVSLDPRKDEMKLVVDVGIVYLFWGVVTYVMSLPMAARASRTWSAIAILFIFALEVCFCLTEAVLPVWMIPAYLTEYELNYYLHTAFPMVLAGLRCVAEYLYVDSDATSMLVITELTKNQKVGLHARSHYGSYYIQFLCDVCFVLLCIILVGISAA